MISESRPRSVAAPPRGWRGGPVRLRVTRLAVTQAPSSRRTRMQLEFPVSHVRVTGRAGASAPGNDGRRLRRTPTMRPRPPVDSDSVRPGMPFAATDHRDGDTAWFESTCGDFDRTAWGATFPHPTSGGARGPPGAPGFESVLSSSRKPAVAQGSVMSGGRPSPRPRATTT